MASFRKGRTAPAPLDQGQDGQESLESTFGLSQKQATKPDGDIADDERHQLALFMSLVVDDNNDTSKDRLRRWLDSSIEADMGYQTNAKRTQCARATSKVDGNVDDEIRSFQAAPVEPDEGRETDEGWLQRALAMLTIDRKSVV